MKIKTIFALVAPGLLCLSLSTRAEYFDDSAYNYDQDYQDQLQDELYDELYDDELDLADGALMPAVQWSAKAKAFFTKLKSSVAKLLKKKTLPTCDYLKKKHGIVAKSDFIKIRIGILAEDKKCDDKWLASRKKACHKKTAALAAVLTKCIADFDKSQASPVVPSDEPIVDEQPVEHSPEAVVVAPPLAIPIAPPAPPVAPKPAPKEAKKSGMSKDLLADIQAGKKSKSAKEPKIEPAPVIAAPPAAPPIAPPIAPPTAKPVAQKPAAEKPKPQPVSLLDAIKAGAELKKVEKSQAATESEEAIAAKCDPSDTKTIVFTGKIAMAGIKPEFTCAQLKKKLELAKGADEEEEEEEWDPDED